jgi:hypothetical protein
MARRASWTNRATALAAALAAGAAALMPAGAGRAEGFTQPLFDTFVDARAGAGQPVWWYSIGTVRAFPSGELLFRMEGFDAARLMPRQRGSGEAVQLSRKIYVMRDPQTNQVVETYEGRPVAPIAYPYQLITYRLNGDDVDTFVEQGAGARLQRLGPISGMTARMVGNTAAFTAPLYLDIPLPTGSRMQVFENYDFFIHPARARLSEPHQLSWMRTGPLPPWAGGRQAVMHLTTWRVERYEDLPATIRAYVEEKAPLWRTPPADLAEIRRLQTAEAPR